MVAVSRLLDSSCLAAWTSCQKLLSNKTPNHNNERRWKHFNI